MSAFDMLSGAMPGISPTLALRSLSDGVAAAVSPTSTSILDGPEVDGDNCRLMGPFALFVQAMMGILVVGSLILKRQRERPKRKWKIWILDITKQMLGQLFVHILNVMLSDFGAHQGGDNPCSLYFLNILIDTTLGVFFIYTALRIVTHVLTDVMGLPGFVSGQYEDGPARRRGRSTRPKLGYWLRQLGTYLFVLFLMKLAVVVILAIFPFLINVGSWILGLFGSHKDAQVLFSMALFPLAMNVLQFWLIDSLLRHNPDTSKYAKISRDEENIEPPEERPSTDSFPRGVGPSSYQDEHLPHQLGDSSDEEDGSSRRPSQSYPPPTDSRPSSRTSKREDPKSPLMNSSIDSLRMEAGKTLRDSGTGQEDKGPERKENHGLRNVSSG